MHRFVRHSDTLKKLLCRFGCSDKRDNISLMQLKITIRNKYLFLSLYSTYKHITRNISGHGHNLLAIQSVIHRNLKTDHLCLSMGK